MSFEPNLSHTFMSKGSSYHITSHHIEHNFNFTVTWHVRIKFTVMTVSTKSHIIEWFLILSRANLLGFHGPHRLLKN
jgi:hypothetical protein